VFFDRVLLAVMTREQHDEIGNQIRKRMNTSGNQPLQLRNHPNPDLSGAAHMQDSDRIIDRRLVSLLPHR